MLSSLKRVREEEQEEGRSVRQRRLATSMGELEEMVLANRRITDSLVGDMEARVEVLEEELEHKVLEAVEKDKLLKVKKEAIKKMEIVQQAELKVIAVKLKNTEKKMEALENFEDAAMQTLVNPKVVEALGVIKRQEYKIFELERKLKDAEEKTAKSTLVRSTKEPVKSFMKKLSGINISVVRTGDNLKVNCQPNETNVQKSFRDFPNINSVRNIITQKPVETTEENKRDEIEEEDSEDSEEDLESPDEQVEMPEDVVTLAEAGDSDMEEVEFDPFWFCGPPSADLVKKKDADSKQDKKPKKDEEQMWKMEDGEDCADCFKNWVHECLVDILAF